MLLRADMRVNASHARARADGECGAGNHVVDVASFLDASFQPTSVVALQTGATECNNALTTAGSTGFTR